MRSFTLICDKCDARHQLGGNPDRRIAGWDYELGGRGKTYCPACKAKMERERQRQ
jgi:hypothetical protein